MCIFKLSCCFSLVHKFEKRINVLVQEPITLNHYFIAFQSKDCLPEDVAVCAENNFMGLNWNIVITHETYVSKTFRHIEVPNKVLAKGGKFRRAKKALHHFRLFDFDTLLLKCRKSVL